MDYCVCYHYRTNQRTLPIHSNYPTNRTHHRYIRLSFRYTTMPNHQHQFDRDRIHGTPLRFPNSQTLFAISSKSHPFDFSTTELLSHFQNLQWHLLIEKMREIILSLRLMVKKNHPTCHKKN